LSRGHYQSGPGPGSPATPAREVTVRLSGSDGTFIEVTRYGRRGMSPQAAAAFAELRPSARCTDWV